MTGYKRSIYNLFGWEYYGELERYQEKQKHLKYKLNNEIKFKFYVKQKAIENKKKRQIQESEFFKYKMQIELMALFDLVRKDKQYALFHSQ